ncbi:hypothetical protein Efla_005216 [Eimeria flavescens]
MFLQDHLMRKHDLFGTTTEYARPVRGCPQGQSPRLLTRWSLHTNGEGFVKCTRGSLFSESLANAHCLSTLKLCLKHSKVRPDWLQDPANQKGELQLAQERHMPLFRGSGQSGERTSLNLTGLLLTLEMDCVFRLPAKVFPLHNAGGRT